VGNQATGKRHPVDARGEPIWEVIARYLRAKKIVRPVKLNQPRIVGVERNPGIALP
jgi:sulfur-oxidizing protein SoxB